MNSEIIIPKEKTYKLNEGHYRSTISGVTIKKGKGSGNQNCYIHFGVNVPGMERFDCCARAIFPLDLRPGSQLRCFLEGILGQQFFAERSGQCINLDEILRDKHCEIEIVHGKHDPQFDWPMVVVENAWPVQTKEEKK